MSDLYPSPSAVLPPADASREAALPLTPVRPEMGLRAFLLAAATLWQREILRFVRQRSRVVGAFLSPLLFWLLLGSGIGTSFRPDNPAGAHYLSYFFPGTIVMILLFTSIFSTISLIEDRREGFLQGVLVSPISRGALVLGKVLGGTTLAVLQALVFAALAPLVGLNIGPLQGFALMGAMALVAFGLTSLGVALAWQCESTQGFHAMMNVVLFPMWLLSGAVFPPSGASEWVRVVMQFNPLSYGQLLIRNILTPGSSEIEGWWAPQPAVVLGATATFAVVSYLAAWFLVSRVSRRPRL